MNCELCNSYSSSRVTMLGLVTTYFCLYHEREWDLNPEVQKFLNENLHLQRRVNAVLAQLQRHGTDVEQLEKRLTRLTETQLKDVSVQKDFCVKWLQARTVADVLEEEESLSMKDKQQREQKRLIALHGQYMEKKDDA